MPDSPASPFTWSPIAWAGSTPVSCCTDARWQEDRVLSLTTVGSPHLGSSLAEQAKRRLDPFYRLLRTVGWDHQGVLDILPTALANGTRQPPGPTASPATAWRATRSRNS